MRAAEPVLTSGELIWINNTEPGSVLSLVRKKGDSEVLSIVNLSFWDFLYIDPLVDDFYASSTGKHHLNMGTIPRWMFAVAPIEMPSDPGASVYRYTDETNGNLLKDPSGRQFAQYQARIYRWYTQGGFTDELGKHHSSGHHYKWTFGTC
jgi:hypothetical protein